MAEGLVARSFSQTRRPGIVNCSIWLPPQDAERVEHAVRAAVQRVPGSYQIALHPGRRQGSVEISVTNHGLVRAAEMAGDALDRPDAVRAAIADLSRDRRAHHHRRPA